MKTNIARMEIYNSTNTMSVITENTYGTKYLQNLNINVGRNSWMKRVPLSVQIKKG